MSDHPIVTCRKCGDAYDEADIVGFTVNQQGRCLAVKLVETRALLAARDAELAKERERARVWKRAAKKWRHLTKEVDAECMAAHQCELTAQRQARGARERGDRLEAQCASYRAAIKAFMTPCPQCAAGSPHGCTCSDGYAELQDALDASDAGAALLREVGALRERSEVLKFALDDMLIRVACQRTGNVCGTDTRPLGRDFFCSCSNCAAWRLALDVSTGRAGDAGETGK